METKFLNPEVGGANPDNYEYVQLVGVNDVFGDNRNGTTFDMLNLSVIFEDNFSIYLEDVRNDAIAETVVHEFGLNVGVLPVVHNTSEVPYYQNHEGTDYGVMATVRDRDNGIAEFHLTCIYFIRDLLDLL